MATVPSNVEAFGFEWAYHILPDGRGVKFSFHEPTHTYRIEEPFDKRCFDVPSVTGVIKSAGLEADYSMVPMEVLERKRVIGSYVHKAIHLWQLGELDLDTLDPQVVLPYFTGYLSFLRVSGFKVISTERRVVGCVNGLWWAGTIDITGEWQGSDWILDAKCISSHYPAHEYQTAGYALTLPKPARPPFKWKRGTLRLCPDGTFAPPKAHTNRGDEQTFLSALSLMWERKRRGIK